MKIFLTLLMSLFLFVGCTTKEIVPKYVYLKPEYPTLYTYDVSATMELSIKQVKIDGVDKICVKEWDGCIIKSEFFKLTDYINDYKTNLKKCNNQAIIFNKKFVNSDDINNSN